MPAKGKHRRPKSPRLTRSMAVAGSGGAALALPLMGATGAHAATAQSVSEKAVQSLPAIERTAVKKAPAGNSGAARSAHRVYTVVPGDCLSEIAREQNVRGGWHRLYADNRQAVGDNPSLIHPGLKLTLGGRHAVTTDYGSRPQAQSNPRSTSSSPASSSSSSSSSASSTDGSGGSVTTVSGFSLPVATGALGTGYHVAGSMWSSGYHTGVDFVVPTGTPVKAVGEGTVVTAGWGGAYGNQVVIRLADGYYAQYGHLSALSVSVGQTVTAGQQVGLSGATGNVTGPHLHFEIRTTPDYGSDVDPVAYLRSKGVAVG
ncbi:MAG: peptidoglycan DD-metalloendopeptidase family protein [Streptomyces sp.]|jgi:murein DD-endopeptidase MepM/ murein hydrolase activator NlpD|uniref:M23 family metallopeptidase n=1 Tax=Streptomyces sp. TaxID=1931 RepID=UPI0025DB4B34|nr:LysM peptidoglycan-binding domain-containing M23 family metallopeptidase [Streptomyces sp.]MBW8793998.1 peptidoglycan DD-metalloendopeptidase family protein [Streptomyces sp.]